MIVFISIFDLLSMSVNISFTGFLIEEIIPHASAAVALIFLIRYIWTTNKKKSDTLKKLFFVP